jgi:hypothetical protein
VSDGDGGEVTATLRESLARYGVAVRPGRRRKPTGPWYRCRSKSPEILGNLLYLIRRSLDDPAKATLYLDLADKVLVDIAANHSFAGPGRPTQIISEAHNTLGRSWLTSGIVDLTMAAMSTVCSPKLKATR